MPEISVPADWDLSRSFQFNGQSVRYGVIGNGSPLVLLHGTPFSSIVWRRIAPYFAQPRTVYYFDMLGYGRSEMSDGEDVSLGEQNKMFTALLAHWGLDEPDVVEHDFGGATALRAHLLDGRNYRSLTLIDPVAIAPWGSPFVRHVREYQGAFASLPAYIHSAILRAYIAGAAFRPLAEADMQLYTKPWEGSIGQPAFYRQIAQMDQKYTDQIEPLLGEVRCPLSLFWGEEDSWIPLAQGKLLSARLPSGRFQIVPRAGHLMQEDAPEAIVAGVLNFLSAGK